MSTNDKNKLRPAFLMNFTNYVMNRFIAIEDSYAKKIDINSKIGAINEEVNLVIHNLNLLIPNRNIPYIKVKAIFLKVNSEGKDNLDSKDKLDKIEKYIRIVIDKLPPDDSFDYYVEDCLEITREEISHVVDVLIAYGQNVITVSSLCCDAKLVLDESLINHAIADVLLDISMFNSHSFLKELDIEGRKDFSRKKIEFCANRNIKFYEVEEGNQQYFSLAFAARDKNGELDLTKYIALWNEFLNLYFPDSRHVEENILEQLSHHKDLKQLPTDCVGEIKELENGAYLLLRTNKDRTETIHPQLYALFGKSKKKYRSGLVHIVPITDYEKVYELLVNLDVSAFKIVVNSNNLDKN